MPLEPQAEALLKKLVDSGVQPFETMTLAESRPELTAPPQVRFSSRLTIGWPSSHSYAVLSRPFPPYCLVLLCPGMSGPTEDRLHCCTGYHHAGQQPNHERQNPRSRASC